MRKQILHDFAKYLVDLVLLVFWIYVPMYHFGLKDSPNAVLIWAFDLVTIAALLWWLHQKGAHKL